MNDASLSLLQVILNSWHVRLNLETKRLYDNLSYIGSNYVEDWKPGMELINLDGLDQLRDEIRMGVELLRESSEQL
jgi:hypothetical protein